MTRTIAEMNTGNTVAAGATHLPTPRYLRINQIVGPDGPLPISRSGFWAGVKQGKFPKPRKISPRVTVWRTDDILALLAKIERGAM